MIKYAAILCDNLTEVHEALRWLRVNHPEIKWCTGNDNDDDYKAWLYDHEYNYYEDDDYALFFEAGTSMFIRCKEYVRVTQTYSPDEYVIHPLYNESRTFRTYKTITYAELVSAVSYPSKSTLMDFLN